MDLKYGVSVKVHIGEFVRSTDGFTPATTVALGAADEAELLKHNSTAITDISGRTWAALTGVDGWYALTLTTADVDTPGPMTVVVQDDSLCLPVHRSFDVLAANVWDSKYSTGAGFLMHSSSAGNYGGKIDNIITSSTAIVAKLPTNYIMGSTDVVARSAAIDAIETETTGLAGDVSNLIAATTAIWAETTGLQAKLPSSFILGSSSGGNRGGTIDTINTNVSGLNDISAADVTAAVPTTAEIADAVWDESSSDHNTTGTMGWYANLSDEIKAGTTAIEVETSGLATDVSNLIAATTAIWAETTGLQAKLPTNFIMGSTTAGARAGTIDAINTAVGALNDLGSSDITAAVPTTAEIADAVWDESSTAHNTTGTMGWYANLADDIQTGTTAIQAGTTLLIAGTTAIQAATTAIWAETTGLNAKLPTNFIMGSTDGVARSAKVDALYTFGAHSSMRKGVAKSDIMFQLSATSDGRTPVTGASADVHYSLDASTWVASTGTVSEIGYGAYAFDASSSETNGDVVGLRFSSTESGAMTYYFETST